ncbi:SRPBCC domain-containing protein [Gramella sp. AN32]|uniref:SRPBCC domain-containing protein n=1 Tax=Christiangramia antarctica TaxID=2058158 RepID=A0ABW5X4V9_9FLAO|nr:ATPase [Gramella sp. AN32]
MEQKTKVNAEEGKQELLITREFDLPLELLFKAYVEPEIVEQWMGTNVLKLESKNHGSYQFETKDDKGKVMFKANGVIHELVTNKIITRTFQMENTSFPVQLEYLEFEELTDQTSKLEIKIVFKSIEDRNQLMKLPFTYGLNMAHNRLQDIVKKLK